MEGVINLDKPAGLSSARAAHQVKRLLPPGTRIGHAGTLDPFATGVLLLLVGRATRQCEALMNQPKSYEAVVKLGATTETDDRDSPERAVEIRAIPQAAEVDAALARFVGEIEQRPPTYCALKVGGRRAYALARSGKMPRLEPRRVRIDAIQRLDWQWPLLRLRVDCGRGTYIRSIARDLGEALGTGGYLLELRRTRVGPYAVDEAIALAQLLAEGPVSALRPMAQTL